MPILAIKACFGLLYTLSMNKSNLATYLKLAMGMAIFGSGLPVSKIVVSAFQVFIASELRMLVAFLVLVPFVISDLPRLKTLERKDYGILFLIALVGLFFFSVAMLYGMKMLSGVVGSVIMSTTPIMTAIASVLFFKDRITKNKIIAVFLAVAGIVLIQMQGNSSQAAGASQHIWLGSLLIFIAVCCEAAYTLLGKKAGEDLNAISIACLSSLMAMILFLPFAIYQALQFDFSKPSISDWFALLWFGAGSMSLGTVIWYNGIKEVRGSIAAGFMGMMPLSALILSYILLHEPFHWVHTLGMGLELLAIYFITKAHAKDKQMSH